MHPTFIIIGAPKAGTTSLHYYLDQHPDVAMSQPKELLYFNRSDWRERTEWYLSRFRADAPVRGEATPSYASNAALDGIAERMHSLVPDVRLIYQVRDPIQRTISHWVQKQFDGDRRSFDSYVREAERLDNPIVGPSRYATQLEAYLRHYPAERILVIDQDDLRSHRNETVREVFRFLGVEPSFSPSNGFELELNTSAEKFRFRRMGRPIWRNVLGPAVRRLPEGWHQPVAERIVHALSSEIAIPVPDCRQHSVLSSILSPEVARLRELTCKGFSSWSL